MSKQPSRMDLTYPSNRLSTSSEEQSIFYIDDPVPLQDCLLSPERPSEGSLIPRDEHSSFDIGALAELHPSPRPRSYHQRRRNSSVSSQCSGSTTGVQGRPRRHRRPSEYIEGSGRRASTCHGGPGRPRSGSYARVTPLGDGRRASLCKSSSGARPPGQRSRRASTAGRRDSVRPSRSEADRSPSVCFTPISIAETSLIKEPHEIERQRRHRRIALVLLVTFGFILVASVLAVVVTLTHSSFYKPPTGSRELAEHRAQLIMAGHGASVRKENEELLNSLNRQSTPENATTLQP